MAGRYDIEDALIMNRASLDRGFGRCMLMRKHGTVLKKYANRATDTIVAPDRTKVRQLPSKTCLHVQPSNLYIGSSHALKPESICAGWLLT